MSFLYERPYVEFRLCHEHARHLQDFDGNGTPAKASLQKLFPTYEDSSWGTGYDGNHFINTIQDTSIFGVGSNANSNSTTRVQGHTIAAGRYSLEYEVEAIINGSDGYTDDYWLTPSTSTDENRFFVSPDAPIQNISSANTTTLVKTRRVLPRMEITTNFNAEYPHLDSTTIATKSTEFIIHFKFYAEFEVNSTTNPGTTDTPWSRTKGCRSLYYKLIKLD